MSRRIVILQGHPDAGAPHLCHALADAYARGAEDAGHDVRRIEVARLDFPLLRSAKDWSEGTPSPDIMTAQGAIAWADHLVLLYPLWLGTMPALVKAFLEQVLRPGLAATSDADRNSVHLKGKSARVVVTMGMPAFVYRWYFGAHSLKSLERNVLKFCGIRPVRESLFGMVEAASDKTRQGWLDKMRALGAKAS